MFFPCYLTETTGEILQTTLRYLDLNYMNSPLKVVSQDLVNGVIAPGTTSPRFAFVQISFSEGRGESNSWDISQSVYLQTYVHM